jgi:hypothetical protein
MIGSVPDLTEGDENERRMMILDLIRSFDDENNFMD